MSFTLIAHTGTATGINGGTTGSINCTGADLIVIYISQYQAGTGLTISDSQTNTYTSLTRYTASDVASSQFFYVHSPSVSSAMTFTVSGSGIYATICVAAFSGSAATPFDVQNGNAPNVLAATTVQPGSITPGQNNELIVSGFSTTDNTSGTDSVDSSMTISDQVAWGSGTNEGGALAYLIQGTASAINPTWTVAVAGTKDLSASIASFKASAGGSSPGIFWLSKLDGIGGGGYFRGNRVQ